VQSVRRPVFEVWPDIGAPLPARLTDEMRLQVRQANIVRLSIPAELCKMSAFIVRAVDQETANAG